MTEVIVAVIGAGGTVAVAVIGAWTQMWLRRHVGHRNGVGPLNDAVVQILRQVGRVEAKLDQHLLDHASRGWNDGWDGGNRPSGWTA